MNAKLAWRYRITQVGTALVALAILVQITRIQNSVQAQAILDDTYRYEGEWTIFYPPRGEIFDRNGKLLAGNTIVYEVAVNLQEVENPHTIALATSVHLGLDYATVYDQITNPGAGVVSLVLDDYVSPDRINETKKLMDSLENETSGLGDANRPSLAGLTFNAHLQRSYPENSLASNILGYVNRELRGYYGIEEKYNDQLAGVPVTAWVPLNPNLVEEAPEIRPSTTLVLTIDRDIQSAVEQILDESIGTYGAESGTILVMDPQTGDILAMASTPRLNLNEYWNINDIFPGETPFNRAISQAYEPGSVFKILTMASALDAGVVQPGTIFVDTGIFTYGGTNIRNWDGRAWGAQDMIGCLQHSLNVCLAWVATQLGAEDFYRYMQAFGLGHKTGIDLTGEISGRLKLPGDTDWYPVELATNSFGQGVSVTPIQMVMAASAIANKGQMVYPHLLKTIVQDGQVREITAPQIVGWPISEATARTLSEMLAISLENEASDALVEGYRVAGKTGTAQIPTPYGHYDFNQTNASFIGWGPVDEPRFMVYVWLEKPSASIWGSETAAPTFSRIVQRLVVLMDIPPDSVRLQATTGP